jgi:hypothetical protein
MHKDLQFINREYIYLSHYFHPKLSSQIYTCIFISLFNFSTSTFHRCPKLNMFQAQAQALKLLLLPLLPPSSSMVTPSLSLPGWNSDYSFSLTWVPPSWNLLLGIFQLTATPPSALSYYNVFLAWKLYWAFLKQVILCSFSAPNPFPLKDKTLVIATRFYLFAYLLSLLQLPSPFAHSGSSHTRHYAVLLTCPAWLWSGSTGCSVSVDCH